MFKKIKYKGKSFYLKESSLNSIKGFRTEVMGLLFIIINKNLTSAERSKELHSLLKGKDLYNIYRKRVKCA